MVHSMFSMPLGSRGRVISIEVEGTARRRLLDIGLVPGTVIESVRRSPAGDPTAFCIRGATIALRAEDAAKVLVRAF
ncbi:MAG: FeoA family protein [Bacteroidota bacterium]